MAITSGTSSTDLPPPNKLREEARIQLEVQNRLKQLADQARPGTEKIKSQRGGSVKVFVQNKVKWPHKFVLSGQNKDKLSYNQLSPIQWVARLLPNHARGVKLTKSGLYARISYKFT